MNFDNCHHPCYNYQTSNDADYFPRTVPSFSLPVNLHPSLGDNHCSDFYHHTLTSSLFLSPFKRALLKYIKFTYFKCTIQLFLVPLQSSATMIHFYTSTNSKNSPRNICTPTPQLHAIIDLLSIIMDFFLLENWTYTESTQHVVFCI